MPTMSQETFDEVVRSTGLLPGEAIMAYTIIANLEGLHDADHNRLYWRDIYTGEQYPGIWKGETLWWGIAEIQWHQAGFKWTVLS